MNAFREEVWEAECPKKRRLVKSVISRSVLNQVSQNEVAMEMGKNIHETDFLFAVTSQNERQQGILVDFRAKNVVQSQ